MKLIHGSLSSLLGELKERGKVDGVRVPGKLADATEDRLAEVRGRIEAAGLAMRDGILAADAETLEGVLG